jgi:hypothetical protein
MANKYEWRPIDTAEKREEDVLLLSDGNQVAPGRWTNWGGISKGFWDFLDGEVDFKPTYWMPLPAAPYKDDKRAGHQDLDDDGA